MDLQVSTEMSITLGEDGVSMEVVAEEQLYCVCQTPWDINNRRFMIHCDHCQNWFHGDCVGISEKESQRIDSYSCPRCETVAGPSKYKLETDEGNRKLMKKRYSPEYRRRLKEFCFLPSDDVILTRPSGVDLKVDEFVSKGFFRPYVVDKMDGLGLRVPPSTFTVRDVERYLDPDRVVDVIDVEQQTECKMAFRDFANYFTDVDRKRLLNLISLEVSDTKMGALVEPPYIARKLDFLTTYWPDDAETPEGPVNKPVVAKYCLISAKDSYTDFHIDFGGTSVWYHVLWGQKVFYLIEPTQVNLDLYNRWLRGDFGNECFLPDEVQQCYRCVLNKGQTLFIPTGWIHAVYTPHDSLVFGGNFLHKLNIGLQLQIHAMERKSAIAAKYLFPNFETTHWYAAKGLVHDLKRYHKKVIPPHVLQGVRDLLKMLKAWLDDFDTKKTSIPIGIDPYDVVKDLSKEIKQAEKFSRKFDDKSSEGSPKLIIRAGSLLLSSADEHSKSSADLNLTVSEAITPAADTLSLGSPDAQVRIKMKISRKSIDDWSQSPHHHTTSEGDKEGHSISGVAGKLTSPFENLSRSLEGLGSGSGEDSKDSFELYIDETTAGGEKVRKGASNNSRWDTDSSILSSESQSSKSHRRRHKGDSKDRKHKRHKSKHKKKDSDKSKHKHSKSGRSSDNNKDKRSSSSNSIKKHDSLQGKNKRMSLNDALAGALDGMEELIKSSNYAERVAQSDDMPDAVKESVVGLGAMTDSILQKGSQGFDGDDFDLKQVHQDDDYIYLPLVASDDEKATRKKKKKRTRDDDDETWSPTGKLGNVGSRNAKVPRQHAKKKGVEKGLKDAASRPLKIKRSLLSSSSSPKKSFSKKPRDSSSSPKKSTPGSSKNLPSTSQQPSGSSASVLGTSEANKAAAARKWKKGMQTPKQRLSKILKMGKFFNH